MGGGGAVRGGRGRGGEGREGEVRRGGGENTLQSKKVASSSRRAPEDGASASVAAVLCKPEGPRAPQLAGRAGRRRAAPAQMLATPRLLVQGPARLPVCEARIAVERRRRGAATWRPPGWAGQGGRRSRGAAEGGRLMGSKTVGGGGSGACPRRAGPQTRGERPTHPGGREKPRGGARERRANDIRSRARCPLPRAPLWWPLATDSSRHWARVFPLPKFSPPQNPGV